MERNINYTVDINEIHPKSPQFAGVQGEHNATFVKFSFTDEFNAKLQELSQIYDYIQFRIDYTDSLGAVVYGEVKDISEISQPFYLTRAMTKSGGNSTAVLKISCIDCNGAQKEFYTGVMRFYLDSCPSVLLSDDEQGSIISPIVNQARIYRNEAYDCAQTAIEAENSIKIMTEENKTINEQSENNAQMALQALQRAGELEGKIDAANEVLTHCEEATGDANEAVEELKDIKEELAEGGYITGIKESNNGNILGFWVGTQAEYDALSEPPQNTYVIISDDSSLQDLSVDYIVEQGTSGIWTYRKWASGVAECWGKGYFDNPNFTTQVAGWYFTEVKAFYFPNDLFIEAPVGTGKVQNSKGAEAVVFGSTYVNISIAREWAHQATSVYSVCVEAKGRWK